LDARRSQYTLVIRSQDTGSKDWGVLEQVEGLYWGVGEVAGGKPKGREGSTGRVGSRCRTERHVVPHMKRDRLSARKNALDLLG